MRLDISLVLTEEMYRDLLQACQACELSPARFAVECLVSALASRRLPNVASGRDGPRIELPEDPRAEFAPYPVHWPGKTFDGMEPTNEFFDKESLLSKLVAYGPFRTP